MRSSLCRQDLLEAESTLQWIERFGLTDRLDAAYVLDGGRPLFLHRKIWEWVFIAEALQRRGMLVPGRRGLGFGVGTEPLVSVFASFGCEIIATDLPRDRAEEGGWILTGQHASTLADLNHGGSNEDAESASISFREVDMNAIPRDLVDFDFTWSACAFEHLGSIAHGQDFVLNSMRCLRPGGIAVHTTEFNVSSNRRTVNFDETVLYRRRDIDWLVRRLRERGHRIDDVDFDHGSKPADRHIDVPPLSKTHLKVRLQGHVATSLGLIAERGPQLDRTHPRAIHRLARSITPAVRGGRASHMAAIVRAGSDRLGRAVQVLSARSDVAPLAADPTAMWAYALWRVLPVEHAVVFSSGLEALCPTLSLLEIPTEHRATHFLLGAGSASDDAGSMGVTAHVAVAWDILELLEPERVLPVLTALASVADRFVVASIPSFGSNGWTGTNGVLGGKVRSERLPHYTALGDAFHGPVPPEDLPRASDGAPLHGHRTVASFTWWTSRFADAGLIRCASTERRLVSLLERLGINGLWDVYVFRRNEVPEPVGEIRSSEEITKAELAVGVPARSRSSTEWFLLNGGATNRRAV